MKIAVVGVCGSGKTTIVNELKTRGFDAYVVGQEHSVIRDLWKRRNPEAVVFLDVPLEIVRERRGEQWPEWLFSTQCSRLENARQAATVHVTTAARSVPDTIAEIVRGLPKR